MQTNYKDLLLSDTGIPACAYAGLSISQAGMPVSH